MNTLNPKNIVIGQHVTVVSTVRGNNGYEDKSYQGDIMTVLAVDLPYIAVEFKTGLSSQYGTKSKSLDTRRHTFKELSPEYVRVMSNPAKY